MHIYGPPGRYPLAPTATFTPRLALESEYGLLQERLGLERVVVVQPTAYGTDNACTMAAVGVFGARARAVVVVDKSAHDDDLERLARAGARAIRFHMLEGGALPWDMLEDMAARVDAFGWHVDLQLDGRTLPDKESLIERLPCTVVIDHVGKFLEPVPPDHAGFRCLLRLLDSGRVWVKLSAPYEVSKAGPPLYGDVGALARALVEAAPERMLWASNWPHPLAPRDRLPDDAGLLDLLLDWVDDDATRHQILVDNPARLYGFDG